MELLFKVLSFLFFCALTYADEQNDPVYGRPTSCAAVDCLPGFTCRVIQGRAQCIPVYNPCDFACPEIFQPVCGSDRKTYGNECELRLAACKQNKKITVARKGACPPTSCAVVLCPVPKVCQVIDGFAKCVCSRICTLEYAPVCGSDGVTYSNLCNLRSAACVKNIKITVVSKGKCPDPCATVRCGYYAVCKVQNNKPVCVCNRVCPRIYKPVCGSNGKTYSNECLLKVDSCIKQKHITVAYQGKCNPCRTVKCGYYAVCKVQNDKAVCVCNKACPKILKPVCGSNGKTYSNECLLRVDSCTNKKYITVAHQRRCNPCRTVRCGYYAVCKVQNYKAACVCNTICTANYKPVCGSNGKTYSNECLLRVDSCTNKKYIKVAYQGRCRPVY